MLVVPFTRELAEWSPERFVEEVVVGTLHASGVVVGANFRFGKRAAGDVELLRRMGAEHDFLAEGIPLDGGPQVWSSTYVRTCLAAGDVEGAAEALGRPVSVRGVVVRGDSRGRALGYPTANVPTDTTAVPADGVYAGWLRRTDAVGATDRDERLPAAISVGTNPTFAGKRSRRVEAYVLDRDDLELYDREVAMLEGEIRKRLRGDRGYRAIQAINGIGSVMAAILVAEIGDVSRFRSAAALCSWAGLTPKHKESDIKVKRGAMTKQGSRLVRWAVIEGTAHYHGGPKLMGDFRRIAERRGKSRATVAVARKVLTLVYYGLRDGEIRCLAKAAA